jgi:hypothetical protein
MVLVMLLALLTWLRLLAACWLLLGAQQAS